ncbi:VOC family protein [Mucilaginibacter lappiensis]|uniref:Catechol 2,3-dioxygenase-like lactoylglutathione lyase family enzyme n=1 Tax=Mucilaginibacter lappiensis TaxID=354630 RepID=A0A1N6USJ3_9SPHI|nr:VOC family protein [Mucilaginibacter lappiensis]MBB6108939.1 catechol 2,3-dioxygenase-like lactoylglutathione lyase family enzyme [Mucilaginibacter lappiensis]MBB6130532.1 catechol 2,3-dioxygenase-like lactoylglutathione lyase family enzyme [Mucilaginibacter lappiensis]SIQ68557.1 Catechol 2,3-dioxygenase [Mucilaginibacter lappiensis]
MKLNHINLPVTDVAASIIFFEQYFNFKCVEIKGDNLLAVLQGSDSFTLVLMANSFNRKGNSAYPDAFHIGFFVENRDKVMDMYNRLLAGGYAMEHPPGSLRGSYGFYFNAPGNLLTEITCHV